MRISEGSGNTVTVVATVYAEDASLADAVKLERVSGGDRSATLRVRYPYDRVSTFRYRSPTEQRGFSLLDFGSTSTYEYDGRSVDVNPSHGKRLHADVEIKVPHGSLKAGFRNLVGLVDAEGLQGQLRFDVESADLRLRRLDGDLVLEGSSGDIRASDIRGTWKSEFSSGDLRLDGFDGDSFDFHAESGDLSARNVRAARMRTETSSGDVKISSADVEEFSAEASSGDVSFTLQGSRARSIEVTTASGDVSLRLPDNEAFEALTDTSSGDVSMRFRDITARHHGGDEVDYRHGTGGARIHVTTSSGDMSISPI